MVGDRRCVLIKYSSFICVFWSCPHMVNEQTTPSTSIREYLLMTMTTFQLQSCNWKIRMFYHNMIEGLIEGARGILFIVKLLISSLFAKEHYPRNCIFDLYSFLWAVKLHVEVCIVFYLSCAACLSLYLQSKHNWWYWYVTYF